jgi:glycosyltransferase involved in cell wall biosynthesis
MSGSNVDGCESQIVKRSGIRVRRSVLPAGDHDSLVKFSVESDCDRAVAVRIGDRDVAAGDIDIDTDVGADDGNCRWTANEEGLSFSRSIVPGDSFVTACRLVGNRQVETTRTPPVIEAIQPIDEQDAKAGVVPRWRGNGTGTDTALANGSVGVAAGATTSDVRADDERRMTSDTANGRGNSNGSIGCLVAIPAYNEAGSIADVISRTEPHADEVLVVDDGSSDETAARAREVGATVVQHERNRGYGTALRRAFREADRRGAKHLLVVDGDGQHDPDDIPRLLDRQENDGPRIVIGSRFVGDRRSDIPAYRRLGLRVINTITNLSMGTTGSERRVRDTQSGFRAYNAVAIDSLANDSAVGAGMGASTDVLHHARQHDFEIEEVGTKIEYDVDSASSHNPVIHGVALVSNLLRTVERDHPIASLGIPGFLSCFIGLGFGYWMTTNYVTTGTFPTGLALSATFFLLIGVFACFTAIILHSLNRYFDSGSPSPPDPVR